MDPVRLCVVVSFDGYDEVPSDPKPVSEYKDPDVFCLRRLSFGYENYDSWGAGQDEYWQDYDFARDETEREAPEFIGFIIASTWNGMIVVNDDAEKMIQQAKKQLKELFPKKESFIVVRGLQR
tara:strand:- start:178 stop:546 length:369 start_codon:yes stop_codon:yes gene_type:complete